jgi:hypothetical protein
LEGFVDALRTLICTGQALKMDDDLEDLPAQCTARIEQSHAHLDGIKGMTKRMKNKLE